MNKRELIDSLRDRLEELELFLDVELLNTAEIEFMTPDDAFSLGQHRAYKALLTQIENTYE